MSRASAIDQFDEIYRDGRCVRLQLRNPRASGRKPAIHLVDLQIVKKLCPKAFASIEGLLKGDMWDFENDEHVITQDGGGKSSEENMEKFVEFLDRFARDPIPTPERSASNAQDKTALVGWIAEFFRGMHAREALMLSRIASIWGCSPLQSFCAIYISQQIADMGVKDIYKYWTAPYGVNKRDILFCKYVGEESPGEGGSNPIRPGFRRLELNENIDSTGVLVNFLPLERMQQRILQESADTLSNEKSS